MLCTVSTVRDMDTLVACTSKRHQAGVPVMGMHDIGAPECAWRRRQRGPPRAIGAAKRTAFVLVFAAIGIDVQGVAVIQLIVLQQQDGHAAQRRAEARATPRLAAGQAAQAGDFRTCVSLSMVPRYAGSISVMAVPLSCRARAIPLTASPRPPVFARGNASDVTARIFSDTIPTPMKARPEKGWTRRGQEKSSRPDGDGGVTSTVLSRRK